MKIFISAGHNLKDQGTSWETLKENELTSKVRDKLFDIVRGEYFFPPDNLTLRETIDWINKKAGSQDFALEIHFNANNDINLRGVEAYYFGTNRYAEIFSKEVALALGIPNRGAKPDTMSYIGELGFLRQLKCPSVLIECLYLSNIEDRISLDIPKIAQGIKTGLNILFSPIKPPEVKIEELKKQLSLLQRLVELWRQLRLLVK